MEDKRITQAKEAVRKEGLAMLQAESRRGQERMQAEAAVRQAQGQSQDGGQKERERQAERSSSAVARKAEQLDSQGMGF